MKGKTILITGANSGIGRAAALNLATQGAEIIMVTRKSETGVEAKKQIEEASNSTKIHQYTCDLASQNQIKLLSDQLHHDFNKIDILLNNAGIIKKKHELTEDQIEQTFAVNHLSHFLLTQLNIDLLRQGDVARIINVSSMAHMWGKINYKDINLQEKFTPFKAYSQSKLANVLFTYSLCRKVFKEGITSNAVHPGMVGSRFGFSRNGSSTHWLMKAYQKIAARPEKGAETLIYLASSPEVINKSGGYYVSSKPKTSSKSSYDPDAATALWNMSLRMVGMEKSLI